MKNPNICTICGAENKSGDIQCVRCGLPCDFYAATPQPQPTAGIQDVLPEVIKDLQARDLVGRLRKALTETNATPLQRKMAHILLAINGIENAMEFVAKINAPGQMELFRL